jgi:hypothetical protein
MNLKKTTKGTAVYTNEADGFPGVYIPKQFVPKEPPARIYITISTERPDVVGQTPQEIRHAG